MSDKPDLGEQMLSKAVEIGLTSQMDEVDNLEVDIRTDPLKVMQGKVDSVAITGEGVVVQQDLRTEKVEVRVGSVAINPFKAALGQIELTQPTTANAEVILTEADVERAFNSDFVKDKLQQLQVHLNGNPVTINTRHVNFKLPGEGRVALNADVEVVETGETKQIAFSAIPRAREDGQGTILEDVQYPDGEDNAPELTDALLENARSLLDLRNFDLDGMALTLRRLDAQSGKLILEGNARVEQLPTG